MDTPLTAAEESGAAGAAGARPSVRRSSTAIAAASVVVALSTFVVQWAVGRFATPELTAEFLVYWALLFAAFGVVGGVRNETTRAVGAARTRGRASTRAMSAPSSSEGPAPFSCSSPRGCGPAASSRPPLRPSSR